jgi:ADP-ribose pyrophosphatase YjhB (NUDIX family)
MVNFGAATVVLRDRQVLLIKREDFEVWTIPGGAIDPGESVADAAIRETYEETGLEVQLTQLVGIYSRPKWGAHIIVFAARPIGGEVRPAAGEVLEVGFFDTDALPADLIWWYRQPILDAINNTGGSAVWSQDALWPQGLDTQDRQALYDRRDQVGLSRVEFFTRYLGQRGSDGERRMV